MNKPGTILKNGSIVIQQRGEVVLCVIPHNEFTPYATWAVNGSGDTFHGDYFRDIDAALKGFNDRAGRRAA